MKKLAFSFFALFLLMTLSAQKLKDVVIEGDASFAKGKEIRLIVFDDLLNYSKKTVATERIGKDGKFKLRYAANETTLVQIAIMTAKAEFFIEPEKSYNLTIDANTEIFQLTSPEEYGYFLDVTTNQPDTNELNYKISRFSIFFENITNAYHPYLTYIKNYAKFDTLTSILFNYFDIKYNPTDFYQSYMYYTYGSLESSVFEKSSDSMYKKYFDNEYILYNNPAYMDFFNMFYDNYLYNSRKISKKVLSECINDSPDYLKLFNASGKDPVLQNERIRELVIIKNLGQFYSRQDFDKVNLIALLDYIYKNTHFPEHKKLVADTKLKLVKDAGKNNANNVVLKEVSGADYKFGKPSGKWTYVQFFNSKCEDCIREMLILKELQNKFGDSLQIVSVSVDINFNDFSQFRQSYNNKMFDWKFVHFNDNYEWIDKLQLLLLPEYLLLSPDGKLSERYPALPDKGAVKFFTQKFAPENEEHLAPLEREQK